MTKKKYGPAPVESVDPGSPAEEAGIRAGDMIIRIDDKPLRDVIDCYVLLADDARHRLCVERRGETYEVTVESVGSRVGIQFGRQVFGEITRCNNSCMFCFVDQLPDGLRETLYVKDDDYRLSFLGGNFITLTNLSKDDIERIVSEKLSPLYVSLHATEPEVRERIFGNRKSRRALRVLGDLLEAGIDLHLQIVLVRGVNDGVHLDATLADIRSSFLAAASVGVVPIGISKSVRKGIPESFGYDRGSAAQVLEQLEEWSSSFEETGPYAADEFFFLAGEAPPRANYYGEFPQLENGIGLVRSFVDGFAARQPLSDSLPSNESCLITTPMGAWALSLAGFDLREDMIEICNNSLFGERVTVCGLLPGEDVRRRLSERHGTRRALVPDVALSGGVFIDGISPEDVSSACGMDIVPVDTDAKSLMRALEVNRGDDE